MSYNDFQFNWRNEELAPLDQATHMEARRMSAVDNYDAPEIQHFPTDEIELHQFNTSDNTWTNYPEMIEANKRKIYELKQELAQLQQEVGNADDLDRALAANRARIGDMGNSQAHQNRVETRKAIKANKAREQEFNREELESKLNSIRLQKSWSSGATFAELERQEKEILRKLGQVGGLDAAEDVMTLDKVKAFATGLLGKGKNWTEGQKTQITDMAAKIPGYDNDPSIAEYVKSVTDDKSVEDIKKGAARKKTKEQQADAIAKPYTTLNNSEMPKDKASSDYSEWALKRGRAVDNALRECDSLAPGRWVKEDKEGLVLKRAK